MTGMVLLGGCTREPEPTVTVDVTPVLPDGAGSGEAAPKTAEVPPPKVRPDIQPPPGAVIEIEAPDEIEVVGLKQSAVRDLLGAPTVVSADGPAELWRYRTDNCDLGVYFYFDVEREGFYALQYDVTDSGEDAERKAHACLKEIYRERQQF